VVEGALSQISFRDDPTHGHVFATILTRGPLSRRDVARITGLSQSTVSKAVKPMLAAGYLVEGSEAAQGPGRPVIPLTVNTERHYAVGLKVSEHEAVGVVTDPQARVLADARAPFDSPTVEELVELVAGLVDGLRSQRPEFGSEIEGLGLCLGGHVDGRSGVLRYSPMFGWRDVPLASLLEVRTGLVTVVENDVNALTVAEQWFGAGRGFEQFAVVTVGAGIGCGLIVDGELLHGASGMAGELGHVTVVPEGALCRCGKRGCLETVAADDAILETIAAGSSHAPTTITEAAALARAGDAAAREAFAKAGEALGQAIASLVNLVEPSRIVLSGEGIVASDLLTDSLVDALRRHSFGGVADRLEIVSRPLADETWARGAAANVIRRLIARPAVARAGTVVPQRR
jgi:predicted NBD/HSP70 family sugar kinase